MSGTTLGTAGADNDNITIQNNTISTVYYGIYANGTAAVSAGGDDSLAITNNVIGPAVSGATNTGFAGVWVANALTVSITGNTIQNVTTTAGSSGGIRLDSNVNGATVGQNTLNNINSSAIASGTASITGIYLGSAVLNTTVSKNSLQTIVSTTSSGYGARGIMVNTSNATSNDTIVNNFVTDVFCFQDASNIYWPIGIAIESSSGGINVYFNSVNLFGSHAGYGSNPSGGAAPAFFVNAGVTALDVRDNVFVSSYENTTSTGDKAYGIYVLSANTAFTTINYNDYYASAPGTPVLGFLGADQTTIAQWQTATGQDAQSKNVDPLFTTATNLHLQATSTLLGAGVSIAGVTTDFDGDLRPAIPDIGADEVLTPGSVQFSAANYNDSETNADHTATITVNRTGGADGAVSVHYATSNGTATTADNDYVATSGDLNWVDGDATPQTFTVTVKGDTKFEADETVNLTLSAPTGGATIAGTNPATLTILNDDTAPTFAIGDVTQAETNSGTTTFNFTVTKTGTTAFDSVITYSTNDGTATAPSDYTSVTNGTITILAGDPSGTIPISVNGDTTPEPNETFTVDGSNVTNGTFSDASGLGTIVNDDASVSVAVSPASVLEDGATNLDYTFTRDVTTGTLTVNFSVGGTATFGSDYSQSGAASFTTTTGTVNFGAGNATAVVTLDPTPDGVPEPNETAILTVTSGVGYAVGSPSAATGTITNDDTAETTVAFVLGGNLVITDSNGGTSDDTLTISRNGANVRITDPNNKILAGTGVTQIDAFTVEVPFANLTGNITFNTQGGNDTLTIDLAGGNVIPAAGLNYNGGTQTSTPGDKLIITGGSQGAVTYNYTNGTPGAGSIVMSAFGTVNYTGLEPITNSGAAADVIFNLPVGATNNVTLADDGTAANGLSRLSGANFETTDFSNPTNSVQINRGQAADTMTVNALPDLTSSLFIGAPGSEFTTVSFAGAMTMAVNHSLMAFSSGSMSLTGAGILATSGTGQISLTTASGLTLPAGSSLTTVNGPINLNANQQGVATPGSFIGISLVGATVHATATGVVTVNGRGATAVGIAISGNSLISGGTTSATTTTSVTGTGGPGGTNNHGIQVGDTSIIMSAGGDVSVTGNAGPGANTNHGIILFPGSSGGKITSGGNGNVTVNGTGGANGTDNEGILIDGALTRISAAGTGTVNLTGTGGAGTSKGVLLTRAASIGSITRCDHRDRHAWLHG